MRGLHTMQHLARAEATGSERATRPPSSSTMMLGLTSSRRNAADCAQDLDFEFLTPGQHWRLIALFAALVTATSTSFSSARELPALSIAMVLVPLRIMWRDPVSLGSADAAGACHCDDDVEYAIKDERHHPYTQHNEWFCTKLAEHVHIACPPCAVIEDQNGKMLFGSRWEGGLTKENWWDLVERKDIDLQSISGTLSRILAFDHFIFNDDRHVNNYLVRESRNRWVVLAFDFSRAWTFHGFPPLKLPFPEGSNTRRSFRALTGRLGPLLDLPAAVSVLDRIGEVTVGEVEGIIRSHPEQWLPSAQCDMILEWWESVDRFARISAIKKGIRDGSYL